MQKEWRPIEGYPSYLVSSEGEIVNRTTFRPLRYGTTREGNRFVSLMRDGGRDTKMVKNIVAIAFVDGWSYLYNTAILLDGNKDNLRADNIVWRPRWFALQYAHQFVDPPAYKDAGPIREIISGEIFTTVAEAAVKYGLLMRRVWASTFLNPRIEVFPGKMSFEVIH